MSLTGDEPKTPVFCGEYELMLDEKNRLVIPASVRKDIDSAVHGRTLCICLATRPGVLWMYPKGVFENYVRQLPFGLLPDPRLENVVHRLLSMADKADWDSQGRLVIQERLLNGAQLSGRKEFTLVGAGNKLELWKRDSWAMQRQYVTENTANVLMTWQTMTAPAKN